MHSKKIGLLPNLYPGEEPLPFRTGLPNLYPGEEPLRFRTGLPNLYPGEEPFRFRAGLTNLKRFSRSRPNLFLVR